MSLSLFVSIRSTRADRGGEETEARACERLVAFERPGDVVLMPLAWSRSANFLAASPAGSVLRVAVPLSESSVRPSSTIRALTGARLGLAPMGCTVGPAYSEVSYESVTWSR